MKLFNYFFLIFIGSLIHANQAIALSQYPNLALGKPTTQSSTDAGGLSSRAVDGTTDGNYWVGSVTHTRLENQPWWRVDLGREENITLVKVMNRTDCCTDRLSNFHVDLLDQNMAVVATQNYSGIAGPYTDFFFPAYKARYIRVQLNGTNPLSLAEVVVHNDVVLPRSSDNLALFRPTLQSSTDYGGQSLRAVDGNTNGSYWSNSVTHTGYQNQPWWQVNLAGARFVTEVTLFNRTDCCSERLSDFHVDLLDSSFNTLASRNISETVNGQITVTFPETKAAYVRVQLNGSNYLSLTEVVVKDTLNRTNNLTTGWNAKSVSYKAGEFYQISPNQWEEINANGRHVYTETHRDEWSVYLYDTNAGTYTQLDLWTRKVNFSGNGQSYTRHHILDANKEFTGKELAPRRVTGWTAKSISYDGGAFVQVDDYIWVENTDGRTSQYREVYRDEWSVYLDPVEGGQSKQLDVWTMEIKEYGSSNAVIHRITQADEDRHDYPAIGLTFSETANAAGKTCITTVPELPGNFLCWDDSVMTSSNTPFNIALIRNTDPNFRSADCNFIGNDAWMCYERNIIDDRQVVKSIQSGCGSLNMRACREERHHILHECAVVDDNWNGDIATCQQYIETYHQNQCAAGLTNVDGICSNLNSASLFKSIIDGILAAIIAPLNNALPDILKSAGMDPYKDVTSGESGPHIDLGICTAKAEVFYHIREITGLSNLKINKIALNQASSLNSFALDVEIALPSMHATVDGGAQLKCGILAAGPRIDGYIDANHVGGKATARLHIIELQNGKLKVLDFKIDKLDLNYSSVIPKILVTGLGPFDVALTAVTSVIGGIIVNAFEGTVTEKLESVLAPLLENAVNDAIHQHLPVQ